MTFLEMARSCFGAGLSDEQIQLIAEVMREGYIAALRKDAYLISPMALAFDDPEEGMVAFDEVAERIRKKNGPL